MGPSITPNTQPCLLYTSIRRAGVDINTIDEIVMGECYTAMQGSLPARQVSMRIGLPIESSAVTVNQNCASGMRALEIACNNIQLGKTEICLLYTSRCV